MSPKSAARTSRAKSIPSRARRLRAFTESVIREQTRLAHVHGAVNLAQGFPDFPCDPILKEYARRAVEADHNQYSVTWGLPGLRQAVARKAKAHNGILADPEREVTVTCGSTEAMVAAFLALLDPGREIILFEPFYENYNPDSHLAGIRPRYVPLREPDWSIDEEALKAAFGPKTAAIVITTPHNPTGKVFTRAELGLISALCQKWGALVFSDEIYEHILYDGREHASPASVPGLEDRTVTVGSASKTYGITGWRVGWALAPAPLTASIRQVHDFLTVCAATPLQEAVRLAIEGLGPEYYANLAREYAGRRDRLLRGLEAAGFRPMAPQGAYYAMADASHALDRARGIVDDTSLARYLVSELKVAAVPGSSFYRARRRGPPWLRFCFCKRDATLDLAAGRLAGLRPAG